MPENLSLRGQFQFSVYKADRTLRYSTDPVKNFITSTGLSFPIKFPFADCFRFVSIGLGNDQNTIVPVEGNPWGTTGLQTPLTQYSYIGSRTIAGDVSTTQYVPEACKFVESADKLVLSRAWRIPTGNIYFDQDYNLEEFMVSPGRPYVTGSQLNNKVCYCSDTTDMGQAGKDGSILASSQLVNYCDAIQAFARVVKSIPVKTNDYLVVTYDLNIYLNTGIQNVAIGVSHDGQAWNNVPNWSGVLSGKASLVHHGLKLINDGNNFNYIQRTQPTDYWPQYEYGESFVPPWGAPLEPSCPVTNIKAYISTDNIQFAVNKASGGAYVGSTPSQFGVMGYHSSPTDEVANYFPDNFKNVRQNGSVSLYPDNTDYRLSATADAMGFDVSYIGHSQPGKSAVSFIPSGRTRESIYSFQFWSNDNFSFVNQPVRAMTLGYFDSDRRDVIYPFFDVVFSDSKGKYPSGDNATHTYNLPTESNTVPTGYFYLENGGQLTLTFKTSWSSPCDSANVLGC